MPDDLEDAVWRRVANGWQLKMRLANGKVKKYNGFKEEALKKLQEYMSNTHDKDIKETELRYIFTTFLTCTLSDFETLNDTILTSQNWLVCTHFHHLNFFEFFEAHK